MVIQVKINFTIFLQCFWSSYCAPVLLSLLEGRPSMGIIVPSSLTSSTCTICILELNSVNWHPLPFVTSMISNCLYQLQLCLLRHDPVVLSRLNCPLRISEPVWWVQLQYDHGSLPRMVFVRWWEMPLAQLLKEFIEVWNVFPRLILNIVWPVMM